MAISTVEGLMGNGKSYTMVNKLLMEFLRNTERPIYTNLPLNLEDFLLDATSNVGRRDRFRERLQIAEGGVAGMMKEVELTLPDGTKRIEKHQTVAEFWYFTKPNSVIFIDECAEVYNALESSRRPETLVAYVTHQRHYKDDIFLGIQSVKDLDVQMRRKIQYRYRCLNSTTQNMFSHWTMRGLKWPIQFFFVDVFSCPNGLEDNLSRMEPQESYKVFPKKRGFKNYNSFSASGKLPWKQLADENAESQDIDRSKLRAFKKFFGQVGGPVMIFVGIGVGGFVVFNQLMNMTHAPAEKRRREIAAQQATNALATNAVYRSAEGSSNSVVKSRSERAVTVGVEKNRSTLVGDSAVNASTNLIVYVPERVEFVSPKVVRTNKGVYRIGHKMFGRYAIRFFPDGVLFHDGTVRYYTELFL